LFVDDSVHGVSFNGIRKRTQLVGQHPKHHLL
jgi:hypothetical protein